MVIRATINRRQMLSLIIGSSQVWSSTVSAQERSALRRIGYLMGYPEDDPEVPANFAAFHEGLKAVGLEEGRNVHIDYRWAGLDAERARTLAQAPGGQHQPSRFHSNAGDADDSHRLRLHR
jgi:putative tryptophan/tyrosine transport system substrate-binding protein